MDSTSTLYKFTHADLLCCIFDVNDYRERNDRWIVFKEGINLVAYEVHPY